MGAPISSLIEPRRDTEVTVDLCVGGRIPQGSNPSGRTPFSGIVTWGLRRIRAVWPAHQCTESYTFSTCWKGKDRRKSRRDYCRPNGGSSLKTGSRAVLGLLFIATNQVRTFLIFFPL